MFGPVEKDENVVHVVLMKHLKKSARLQQHGFHLHISNESVALQMVRMYQQHEFKGLQIPKVYT